MLFSTSCSYNARYQETVSDNKYVLIKMSMEIRDSAVSTDSSALDISEVFREKGMILVQDEDSLPQNVLDSLLVVDYTCVIDNPGIGLYVGFNRWNSYDCELGECSVTCQIPFIWEQNRSTAVSKLKRLISERVLNPDASPLPDRLW